MDKLKPCPFCGKREFLSVINSMNSILTWVACNNCGCYGPTKNSEIEAIAAWNHREGEQYDITESN